MPLISYFNIYFTTFIFFLYLFIYLFIIIYNSIVTITTKGEFEPLTFLIKIHYHQIKTLISFWYRQELNLKSIIQPSNILSIELIGTHQTSRVVFCILPFYIQQREGFRNQETKLCENSSMLLNAPHQLLQYISYTFHFLSLFVYYYL